MVRRALKILADREVTPQTGLLKSTLLQLDSTFSERNYGASSFLDFVEKLAKSGYVHLKTSGRSVMVELNEGFVEEPRATAEGEDSAAAMPVAEHDANPAATPHNGSNATLAGSGHAPAGGDFVPAAFTAPSQEPAGPPLGDQADGVARAGQILTAATGARWPMYLRNVKQILRQAEGGFDERRYAFGGLMDLLKALQREGFVRIERDRRGGLRVFQGQALQRTASETLGNVLPQRQAVAGTDGETDIDPMDERQPSHLLEQAPQVDVDRLEDGPMPIDTTAELLGRAKHRKPRVRALVPAAAAAPKRAAAAKPAAKKAAAPKRASRKKPAAE